MSKLRKHNEMHEYLRDNGIIYEMCQQLKLYYLCFDAHEDYEDMLSHMS